MTFEYMSAEDSTLITLSAFLKYVELNQLNLEATFLKCSDLLVVPFITQFSDTIQVTIINFYWHQKFHHSLQFPHGTLSFPNSLNCCLWSVVISHFQASSVESCSVRSNTDSNLFWIILSHVTRTLSKTRPVLISHTVYLLRSSC